jgi:hypothetical protein
MKMALISMCMACGVIAARAHAERYALTPLVSTGTRFIDFGDGPSINDQGDVAFQAMTADGHAVIVWRDSRGSLVTLASTNTSEFKSLGQRPSIQRDSATIAFTATDGDGVGVYRASGRQIATIADSAFAQVVGFPVMQPGPGENAIFTATTLGRTAAICRGNGAAPQPLVTARDGYTELGNNPGVNEAGTLAFRALGPSGPRIYVRSASGDVQPIPLSGFPFLSYGGAACINRRGTVAFRARLRGNIDAMVLGDLAAVQIVADTAGAIQTMNVPSLNDAGEMVFRATLDAGGAGIFRGPHIEADAVVRTGQVLEGSIITDVAMHVGGINSAGQVVLMASVADGRRLIVRADPPPCPADIDHNRRVDVDDLIAVILAWGACSGCPADIAPPQGDGEVNADDLIVVILAWGRCP